MSTIDAVTVIERLNAAGQHQLASEIAVEALRNSGASRPANGTPSAPAAGPAQDPRDQTALERGYLSWHELSQLDVEAVTRLRLEAPKIYAESLRQLAATRAWDQKTRGPAQWSAGDAP